MDDALRARVEALCTEGWAVWDQFALEVREHHFHPFVAADYEVVLAALLPHRGPGRRFLEWGSATGVITIMADLLGFEAYGIELDSSLVATARRLAEKFDSRARFAAGSFLPTGYRWQPSDGDGRTGTVGTGPSGYLQLGYALDDFDVVFGYPWGGEEPMMLDLMKTYGRSDGLLLLHTVNDGVKTYRNGRPDPVSRLGRST
ncbi:MAG: class I SAM-dependent methyltransferase [Gemmatimonadetes bacterium]|nr:class I SAM-dependent methyltransferase [Gemmatimonadota bacterium]